MANQRGILAGRMSDVHLSKLGYGQSDDLVPKLLSLHVDQVYHSPLERCVETIAPFRKTFRQVNSRSVAVKPISALQEMNYGDWTGRSLNSLRKLRAWQHIQNRPESYKFPGGESFEDCAARVIKFIDSLPIEGNFLLVTHGDIIRLALAHYLQMPMNHFQRIAIEPASISSIHKFADGHLRIGYINRVLDVVGDFTPTSQSLGGDQLTRKESNNARSGTVKNVKRVGG
jgi:probable phosphoglycerate mutase